MASRSVLAAIAVLVALLGMVQAIPTFPLTAPGKVPPFTPNATSGQWALLGSYRSYNGGAGNNWRYSGFQVVGVNMTGGVDAWKYMWSFENPWSDKGGAGFYTSSTAQTFEIGYSSQYPLHAASPYVNSYVMNVSTGIWGCYHIPVPKHFTNDFLSTSTASNGTIGGANRVPADWGTYLGDGNLFQLHGGAFNDKIVRLYLNTDRWFQCARCGVLTAMSVETGLMLRQFYIQPTIDFYTDYYDWQVFQPNNPNFIRAFKYTPFIQSVPCVDITNGKPGCWNETGSRSCKP